MSPAEAAKLGLDRGGTPLPTSAPAKKKTRKTVAVKDCAPNRCCTCDETFTTEAAERRHADTEHHHRFEMILPVTVTGDG